MNNLDRPTVWKITLGFLLAMFGIPLLGFVALMLWDMATGPRLPALDALLAGASPPTVLLGLALIVLSLPGIALAMRLLHRAPLAQLFTNDPLRWRWFFAAIAIIAITTAPLLLWPGEMALIAHTDVSIWLRWLAPALFLILLQATAEELLFRGYLQQMLMHRFGSPWVALLLPSALFGLGHWSPESFGEHAALAVVVIGLWGIILAHLTWQCGSLLPAIGMHFANNVIAILIVSESGFMSGLALYILPPEAQSPAIIKASLIAQTIQMLLLYALYQLGRSLYLRRLRSRARVMLHSAPPPSI